MGTNAFMAPEIVSGAKHSGLEDMYSLGITMYVLLMAGVLPFEENESTPDRKKTEISSLFIHPELLDIIRKAAAPVPADRYQSFEAFSEGIRAFMNAHDDRLDEKVPTYYSVELRNRTILPYSVFPEDRTDLS